MILLANILSTVAMVLRMLLNIYFWIVIAAALVTWVSPNPYNAIVRTLRMLTEPLFYKVRKWLPFTYRFGLDFSPVIVLIAIELANGIIVKSLAEYARQLAAGS